MAPTESTSRPTYVFLLALTALLLFGVNFVAYLDSLSADTPDHVVVQHEHPGSFELQVVIPPVPPLPPMPPLAEIREEWERARKEVEVARARVHVERVRAHAPRTGYAFAR